MFVDCICKGKTPIINQKWYKDTIQALLGYCESTQMGKIIKIGQWGRRILDVQRMGLVECTA